MYFLITRGVVIPHYGTSGYSNMIVGMLEAASENDAAQQLGLIRWEGWKNIPRDPSARNHWEQNGHYYFHPRWTDPIDKNPADYANASRAIPFFLIQEVPRITEIPLR